MEVGKEIARLRKERGMTIRELSDKTGITYSSLPNIESGNTDIRIGTLEKIAKGLRIKVSDIIKNAEIEAVKVSKKE